MDLPKTVEDLAIEVYAAIEACDGCGLTETDTDLIVETLSARYGVKPTVINEDYGATTADDEEDEDEESELAQYPWPAKELTADWPTYELVLKGYNRVQNTPDDGEVFDPNVGDVTDLLKWVKAPSEAVVAKWVADNNFTAYLDEPVTEYQDGGDLVDYTDRLDMVLDEEGHVVGGDPDSATAWKRQAAEVGRLLEKGNNVPVFHNFYQCPDCEHAEEWDEFWPGQPDEECNGCGKKISPYKSEEKYGYITEVT